MGLFDKLLSTTPTAAPSLDITQAAIDKALNDAGTVPTVQKDSAQAGVVMEGGQLGVKVDIDKSLGKNGKFGDVIGEAEDSKSTGWKFGAWWKKSWGSK